MAKVENPWMALAHSLLSIFDFCIFLSTSPVCANPRIFFRFNQPILHLPLSVHKLFVWLHFSKHIRLERDLLIVTAFPLFLECWILGVTYILPL